MFLVRVCELLTSFVMVVNKCVFVHQIVYFVGSTRFNKLVEIGQLKMTANSRKTHFVSHHKHSFCARYLMRALVTEDLHIPA